MIKELKQYRKDKGLSQEKMAQKFGVSWLSYHKWENNKAFPHANNRKKINTLLKRNKYL